MFICSLFSVKIRFVLLYFTGLHKAWTGFSLLGNHWKVHVSRIRPNWRNGLKNDCDEKSNKSVHNVYSKYWIQEIFFCSLPTLLPLHHVMFSRCWHNQGVERYWIKCLDEIFIDVSIKYFMCYCVIHDTFVFESLIEKLLNLWIKFSMNLFHGLAVELV